MALQSLLVLGNLTLQRRAFMETGINLLQWQTFLLTVVILAIIFLMFRKKDNSKPLRQMTQGKVPIPYAGGSLPLIGHGLALFNDVTGFLKKCYKRHGKVFKIKIYRTTIVIICDRNLANSLFKASEDELSLYKFVDQIYLSDGFSSDSKFCIGQVANAIKNSVGTQYGSFVPQIEEEANRMILRLRDHVKNAQKQKIDLAYEMARFVAATSTFCFMRIRLPDEIFKSLNEFMILLNFIVNLTFIFPKSVIRFFLQSRLSKIRKRITKYFEPEIEKYLQDPNKCDSSLLRQIADSVHEDTGIKFSNEDIGNFVVSLLYVSTANTALGATNVLVDLAANLGDWNRCKKDAEHYLIGQKHVRGLLESDFLNACVMETARMNSHPMSVSRVPSEAKSTFGNFYLGDVDAVAVCPPMLQLHCGAGDTFSNPGVYNPSRFLKSQNKEPFGQKSIMTWGAGRHLCPGKMFAIYEIKIAVALFLLNFKIEKAEVSTTELSSSAFVEKKVLVNIETV